MSENIKRKIAALRPAHPGELLREDVLPAANLSKSAMARALGVTRKTVYALLEERQSVTPAMALRLGNLFGNGPALWLSMQRAYDLWVTERELAPELAAIDPLST